MPSDNEFKQIVRDRMVATGEKYTTALRAVLKVAQTAVPNIAGSVPEILPGPVIATVDPTAVADCLTTVGGWGRDGQSTLAALADFCEYQAGWYADLARESPGAQRNHATSERLKLCAKEVRSMPASDPRVLVIGAAWANEATVGLMHTVEGSIMDWPGFRLTGEELVELLAGRAIEYLGNTLGRD